MRHVDLRSHICDIGQNLGLNFQVISNAYGASVMVVAKLEEDVTAELDRVRDEIAVEKAEIHPQKRAENAAIRHEEEAERAKRLHDAEACHQRLIDTGNGDDWIGHWHLEIPTFERRRKTLNLPKDEYSMDIAKYKRNVTFRWGALGFGGENGWLRIRQESERTDKMMRFDWDIEYDNLGRHDIGYTIDKGLIKFISPHQCAGYLKSWVGGPFQFKGIKTSVTTKAVASKCEIAFRALQQEDQSSADGEEGDVSNEEEEDFWNEDDFWAEDESWSHFDQDDDEES